MKPTPTPRWPEPFRRDQFDYLTDDELELLIESSSVLQFSPATNSTNGCLVASVGGLSSPADWVGELEYELFTFPTGRHDDHVGVLGLRRYPTRLEAGDRFPKGRRKR